MRIIVKGKNLDVPEADRAYAERKLRRLERLLDDRSEAQAEFSLERHKSVEDSHIVDVTLVIDGRPLRGMAQAATHQAATDEVVDKLERRAGSTRSGRGAPAGQGEAAAAVDRRRPAEPAARPTRGRQDRAVRHRADVRRGCQWIGWRSSDTSSSSSSTREQALAVLYRRSDGDYGLIEPTMGGGYSTNGRGRG